MNAPRNLQLTEDGRWEPFDVSAPNEDISDLSAYLESQGWEPFLTLGAGEWSSLYLLTWRRTRDDGRREYLIEVNNGEQVSEFLKVDHLPMLMDLLARWAPAVQAANVADVIRDLQEPAIEPCGLVESVAARAAWSAQDQTPTLRSQLQERESEVRARAKARRDRRSSE